jgi:hypothetical protein
MGSRFRFFGAGVAVSALCFLLASMTWQYVLGLFVLAGVGWGFWSWLAESEKDRLRARAERARRKETGEFLLIDEIDEKAERIERPITRKRSVPQLQSTRTESRSRNKNNVYQFPKRERADNDHSSRTEAAD